MHRLTPVTSTFNYNRGRRRQSDYGLESLDEEETVPLTPAAAAMGYGDVAAIPDRESPRRPTRSSFGHHTSSLADVAEHHRQEKTAGGANSLPHLPMATTRQSPTDLPGRGLKRRARLIAWMINDGTRSLFITLWILLQVLIFGLGLASYQVSDDWTGARRIYGATFAIAKAAALVLNVDGAFILLPVCRNLITLLRRTPLGSLAPSYDAAVSFRAQLFRGVDDLTEYITDIVVAWSIACWTCVHIAAHTVNFLRLATETRSGAAGFFRLNFAAGPGLTGWIMTAMLAIIGWTSLKRRANYERFWVSHHLFIILFVCWQLHGIFCMMKPDHPPYCSIQNNAQFWKYGAIGLAVYMAERILRERRSRQETYISKVIQHPSRVLEIHIRKEGWSQRAGQYILINCPQISYWQWHPFTLTSAPEEGNLSIHVRIVGDFTASLGKALGCDFERPEGDFIHDRELRAVSLPTMNRVLPRVFVDGPFGSASEDYNKFETVVLVGAGIGVTPFASVLKSIWYRASYPGAATSRLRKAYFIWICRDFSSFEWFQRLLLTIESQDLDGLIEIQSYMTTKLTLDAISNVTLQDVGARTDPITGMRKPTLYGRPNWPSIFRSLGDRHPAVDVGVFFCGPKPIGKDLHKMCNAFTTAQDRGTRYIYHSEKF